MEWVGSRLAGSMTDSVRDWTYAVLIATAWAVAMILWQWNGIHYDLNALYVAGHFLAEGRPDLVYVEFPLAQRPEWKALTEDWACELLCAYPYVYPPIWAELVAPLTRMIDMYGFSNLALLVNIPLFALTPILAWRLWKPKMSLRKWTFRCLFLATFCTVGVVAIINNQPQLAVTFLMLLAFERAARGQPWLGGVALGLAAVIKIYPAIFAVIWLREGQWRPILGAAATGLAILGLNFALVDATLNAAFIEQLGTLSGVSFALQPNYSLISQISWLEPAIRAAAFRGDEIEGFRAVPGWVSPVLLVLAIALVWWRSLNASAQWRGRMMLPMLILGVALASPLAWAHYFFIPLFALQLLPEYFGKRWGTAIMLAAAAMIFVPLHVLLGLAVNSASIVAILGVSYASLSLLILTLSRVPLVRPAFPGYRPAPSTA